MLSREIIEKTEVFLKRKFDAADYLNAHPEAKAYRIEHTYRVANIGRELALKEGFDETEMVIACLLHDVSYCEEFGEKGWIEHGRRAAHIARPFLSELGLAEDRINDICYGIAIHVDEKADFPGERTPFALSVGAADNIDRFDVFRIHETLTHDGFSSMGIDQKLEYCKKHLARLHKLIDEPMGTKTADEMWKARLSFQISFYEKLVRQFESRGLTRSMSKKGCSPDNSACEGFFGRIKNEVFYGRDWKGWTLDDFMYFIDRYLNWFRNERIKVGLNNKSPKEYRIGLGLAL